MDNFKVGDTVQVLSKGNSHLEVGDVGVITLTEWKSAKVKVDGKSPFANWISFKDLKLMATDSQRTLEGNIHG